MGLVSLVFRRVKSWKKGSRYGNKTIWEAEEITSRRGVTDRMSVVCRCGSDAMEGSNSVNAREAIGCAHTQCTKETTE
jgi:hypothetical protein